MAALLAHLQSLPKAGLLVLDALSALPPASAGLHVLTGRADCAAAFAAAAAQVTLADYDFTALPQLESQPQQFTGIALRISKEKALNHYVINQALRYLPPGGCLWLAGHKQEGTKGYIQRAAQLAATTANVQRLGQGIYLGMLNKQAEPITALPDQDYAKLREVQLAPELCLWSKPGIFGWQKLDLGSRLLVDALVECWPTPPASVLDLGCGYGYLAVQAARKWPGASILATDNNVAAIAASARNLADFGDRTHCQLADCGQGVAPGIAAILCNPPFHQGFAVDRGLGLRFLQAAQRLLAPRGKALFVVNEFLPLEAAAESCFHQVQTLRRAQGFKLVVLAQPRP